MPLQALVGIRTGRSQRQTFPKQGKGFSISLNGKRGVNSENPHSTPEALLLSFLKEEKQD